MFKQLISNLPFNPSLFTQVSFYAGRLRKEASFRRLGFVCMILAMFIQMFAVISPPERSLAASDNHIIDGLQTRDDMLRAWDKPGSDVPSIYGFFGLTRADLEKLPQSPNTNVRSNDGNDWWTIGRNSLSGKSGVAQTYKNNEIAIKASPATTIYMRQLQAWGTKTYKAWQGTKSDGTKFWILQDCGNFTQIGKIPPKTPGLELRKTIKNNPASLKPGEEMTFLLEWRNYVENSLAENVVLKDELDLVHFDIVSPTNLPITGSTLNYPLGNLAWSPTYSSLEIKARLKNPLATGLKICNVSSIKASNAPEVVSQPPACVNVLTPCDYDPTKPSNSPDCVEPKLICSSLDAVVKKGTREVTFTAKATSTNPALTTVKSYVYNFGDSSSKTNASDKYTDTATHSYGAGTFTANVTISYTTSASAGTVKQDTCSTPIEFETDKPVGEMKKIKNITQNLEGDAAINSTVKAGDVLEYILTTTNSQNVDKTAYSIEDYIGDVLDYANLDQAFLTAQSGTYNADTKKVVWANQTIPAKSEVVKLFRVTVKSPIPATNAPSGVTTSFDCKISNRYGNEIGMVVACPIVKGIEALPNTGPGESLALGFLITTVIGYFFARSRLMSKELDLIKVEYSSAGA